jgi:hypothetical protein
MKYLLCIALVFGCAPTTRLVTRRCPVPISAVLADLTLGSVAMALSALKWETDHKAQSVGYTSLGLSVWAGSYLSEVSCTRK